MVPTRLSAESCSIATQTPTQAHQLPWAVQRQPRLDPSAGGASSSTRSLTRLFVPLILTGQLECDFLLAGRLKGLCPWPERGSQAVSVPSNTPMANIVARRIPIGLACVFVPLFLDPLASTDSTAGPRVQTIFVLSLRVWGKRVMISSYPFETSSPEATKSTEAVPWGCRV